MTEQYKKIGRVKQAQGLKGELYVKLFARQADWLEKMLDNKKARFSGQEFALEKARPHKDGLVIKLAHLNDRTEAEKMRGTELEIPADYLSSAPGEEIFLHEILNFQVKDQTLGLIGTIVDFSSNGSQDLLVLDNGALIPLVKPFIEKVDFNARTILMILPEGLIEITQK